MAMMRSIIRRSILSVLPALAVRTVKRNQNQQGCVSFSQKLCPWPLASTILHFYSSSAQRLGADDPLVRAVDSEFKEEVPDDFPFKIEDNPGQGTISLEREYKGEVIQVEVDVRHVFEGIGDDDDDDEHGGGDDDTFPLVVTISKKNGNYAEFHCSGTPNQIIANSLFFEGFDMSPYIQETDKFIQDAIQNYLEVRGIKPSIYNFLQDYSYKKKSKEHANWLKNVKKFLEA